MGAEFQYNRDQMTLPAILLSLALSAAAQTGPVGTPAAPADQPKPAAGDQPANRPAVRETPPDSKAYTEASRIGDPQKKIEALEKFKRDFPASVFPADQAILSTVVKSFPDQQVRIRGLAKSMYRAASASDKGWMATQIADQLLDASLLLKDAEGYARTGVQSMNLALYLKEQLASYEKRKQKPPASEELQERFQESRATRVATLGRVEVKLGQIVKGQKLLEESYAVNPNAPAVAGALGELAAKAGDESKALEYLIPACLSGRASATATAALESVYRKAHNGSIAGLDAMLDSEYRKRFPNPIHVEAYQPTEKRSDRLVLAEVFTGAGCPPCVGADLAFDAALGRYSRKDLAVVVYHLHIPRPDPMTNTDTQAAAKSDGVNAVPTFFVDGKKTVGGGGRETAKNVFGRFQPDLEKDLESPAEARLKVEAALAGNRVNVAAEVDAVNSESKGLKLQMALVEKELRYTGENGVRFHPMVVRAMGGENGLGFAVEAGAAARLGHTFDLDAISAAIKAHLDDYEAKGHRGESFKFTEKKYRIDRDELAVVVFVQDDKTKHVLQSVYIDLTPAPGARPVTEADQSR